MKKGDLEESRMIIWIKKKNMYNKGLDRKRKRKEGKKSKKKMTKKAIPVDEDENKIKREKECENKKQNGSSLNGDKIIYFKECKEIRDILN